MKFFLTSNCSQIAVGFLILIQITATVCSVDSNFGLIEATSFGSVPENYFENERHDITMLRLISNHFDTLPENIFANQAKLEKLNLGWNNLKTLPENIFANQAKLQTLYLSSNRLTTLPENIFANRAKLEQLNLGDNKLTTLPENIFASQNNLLLLDLSSNGLKTLPENIFANQAKLEKLDLGWNHLITLPENIFTSQINMQTLQLWENRLETLPDKVFKYQNKLEGVCLEGNNLTTLSKITFRDLFKNSNLNDLDLRDNSWLCDCDFMESIQPHMNRFGFGNIVCADGERVSDKLKRPIISMITSNEDKQKHVSNICESLSSYETVRICPSECNCSFPIKKTWIFLDCSNKNLKSVRSGLGNELQQLAALNEITLSLSNNNLTTLPENIFKNQTNLVELDLSTNNLTTLPEKIFEDQTRLKSLILRRNRLTELHENIFKSLINLQTLHLEGNQLRRLPENIFARQINLKTLKLQSNKLRTLSKNVFKNLINLQTMSLASNRLSTLPDNIFESQTNLQTMSLSWNRFETLNESIFTNQTNLHTLNLIENNLRTLPGNIFESQTNLETLSLSRNRFKTLNESIFARQEKLRTLDISNNILKILPEKIFKNQRHLEVLSLNHNNLKMLHRSTLSDISKNFKINRLLLDEKSWRCDCDFLEGIRPLTKYQIEIVCADGEQLFDKLKRHLISMIPKDSNESNNYSQKYINSIFCPIVPTHDTARICPSGCNCLFPRDNSSIFFDCSNGNLKSIPPEIGDVLHQMPALKEIELNINSNEIVNLPNSTMNGLEFITKITASNNSITSVSIENLPQNLIEIDLSNNKLETLTIPVLQQLNSMKILKRLVLGGNSWTCDEHFSPFILFNKKKVDYEQIVCNDGEPLFQKHNNRRFG